MKRSELANEWYQKGVHEYGAAELLRNECYFDMCALLCHQAAETVVKAVWIDLRASDPPKVHWIEKLTEELGAPESILDDCAVLVADYFASRYPAGGPTGPFGEFTEADADDRLMRAHAVIEWAESHWVDSDE